MLPAEAGEVMHSRKEPCWVASLCACKHCCSEQPTGCAGTACQHQALCLQRCSCSRGAHAACRGWGIMHSRKEPCRVASLSSVPAGTACQQQALC